MKMLKKLALVSAVSMMSAGAFALEALDEETMSATTGQDGVTILVAPGVRSGTQLGTSGLGVSSTSLTSIDEIGGVANSFRGLSIRQVVIHDDDGMGAATATGTGTGNSGAIVIGSGLPEDSTVVFIDDDDSIAIDIDAIGDSNGSVAGGGAMLNVKISTPKLGLKVGSIGVQNSNAAAANRDAHGVITTTAEADGTGTSGTRVEVLSGMEIILGSTTINVQLGNEAQGAMVAVDALIIGGLTINNLALNDQDGAIKGGKIGAKSLVLIDAAGGTNLTAKVQVDVGDTSAAFGEGLYVSIGQLGNVTDGANLTLNNQYLGVTPGNDLGDVQLLGLNLSGTTLVVRGH